MSALKPHGPVVNNVAARHVKRHDNPLHHHPTRHVHAEPVQRRRMNAATWDSVASTLKECTPNPYNTSRRPGLAHFPSYVAGMIMNLNPAKPSNKPMQKTNPLRSLRSLRGFASDGQGVGWIRRRGIEKIAKQRQGPRHAGHQAGQVRKGTMHHPGYSAEMPALEVVTGVGTGRTDELSVAHASRGSVAHDSAESWGGNCAGVPALNRQTFRGVAPSPRPDMWEVAPVRWTVIGLGQA